MKVFRSILAVADQPNQNGDSYSEDCLRKIANESENFEFDGKVLYHVIKFVDPDPDAAKVLEDNFWKLV